LALVIRDANINDVHSIWFLNLDGLGYDYPEERTRQRVEHILSSNDKLLVAELDGTIAGYIHAGDYECTYADSLKYIFALVVDESFREKGIGRTLVSVIERWAKESGASGIRLTSRTSRENAHKFYKACGYVDRNESKVFVKLF